MYGSVIYVSAADDASVDDDLVLWVTWFVDCLRIGGALLLLMPQLPTSLCGRGGGWWGLVRRLFPGWRRYHATVRVSSS